MSRVETVRERIAEENESGDLYLWVGAASVFLAIAIPILGLVPTYCGYRLFGEEYDRRLAGGLLLVVGGILLADLALRMVLVVL